ncbi:phosphoenolpyruvate phosphomutase [Deinococcus aerius]|uniref:Phosphoenolpyruvate phosphomutase n=1 Tax=Deinococcus aerius TaxID=200253 RepID=A0A2I9DIY3_9DEIO|nr:isocitrate lyase/phosphoenolpyruvate mutase family protein [Deinococcus aerius]GBF04731.1 phosphoenolpyruvate phosphomutase [Deinococcus aerius]
MSPHDFKRRLVSGETLVAIGAHNGLSARLGEEAGFECLWASGLEISASRGMPDANIITFSEMADAVRNIVESVSIPVIVDADSGYGNAINVIRTVQELEHAGAAGLCLEDNVFPKRNSFYADVTRDIVDAREHVSKIKAAVYARKSEDFVVIARTEGFIVGLGVDEVLERAHAYADAGADAVLVHSKIDNPSEIYAFSARWDREVPLVAVPTTYNSVTVEELRAHGYTMCIFANHGIRSFVSRAREILRQLRESGSASTVEPQLCTLGDLFGLVGFADLKRREVEFLG